MANEKPAAAPAPATSEEKASPEKKGGMKLMIIAAAVVLLEAGTIGVTVKLASGPKQAMAAQPATKPTEVVEKDAEVKLVEAKLPNATSGKLYLYDLQVVAKVSEKNKEKVTETFSERESEIRDKIRRIIASLDKESLSEPGLETLRRQIDFQLEQDIGKGLVKEVLIPKCTPIRAE